MDLDFVLPSKHRKTLLSLWPLSVHLCVTSYERYHKRRMFLKDLVQVLCCLYQYLSHNMASLGHDILQVFEILFLKWTYFYIIYVICS